MPIIFPNPPAAQGNQNITPLQLSNINIYGADAGNGATLTFYGLPLQQVGLLGQNPATPTSSFPILRYGYNLFNAASDWRLVNASNWRPFYQQLLFVMRVILGRGSDFFPPADRWVFGPSDVVATGSPDPVSTLNHFFGFVNRDTEVNMRVISRVGGVTVADLNTGVARTTVDNGAILTVSYNGAGVASFQIERLELNKTATTVYNGSLSGSLIGFGSQEALNPILSGSTSTGATARMAVVSFNGYYQLKK